MKHAEILCKSRFLSLVLCLSLLLSVCSLYAFPALGAAGDVIPCVSMGSSFIVALNSAGSLYIWGDGRMIGTAAPDSSAPVPLPVAGVTFVSVSAGADHVLALSSVGEVYAFGSDNAYGELGNDTDAPIYTPTKVELPAGASGAVAISAGDNFSLALTADGSVYAWGANDKGQLGIALPSGVRFSAVPVKIPGVTAAKIRASEKSALAIDHTGSLWLWGSVDGANVIDPTGRNPHLPVKKSLADHFALCAAMSPTHLSFVTLNGEVYSYGENAGGQFGNGAVSQTPTTVLTQAQLVSPENAPLSAEALALGDEHTVVLTDEGVVYTFGGSNSCGELGYTTSLSPSHTPKRVEIPLEADDYIVHISAKDRRTAAVDNSGFVWIWGSDWAGSGVGSATPTPVSMANGMRFSLGAAPAVSLYNTSVTANVTIPAPTYSVSIPATMNLGELRQREEDDTTRIYQQSFAVTVSEVDHLFGEKQIKIRISSNGDDFVLTDGAYTLPYTVYAGASGGGSLSPGDVLAAFTADGESVGRICIDQSLITRRGNYTGRLIFTFTVEPISDEEVTE